MDIFTKTTDSMVEGGGEKEYVHVFVVGAATDLLERTLGIYVAEGRWRRLSKHRPGLSVYKPSVPEDPCLKSTLPYTLPRCFATEHVLPPS